jgi:hypothetical protein
MLHQLLETYRPLFEKVHSSEPDHTELGALAAVLHSFYTGIENIFKRIAMEIDDSLPSGLSSHAGLLGQMAQPTDLRPAVISGDLRLRLRHYLDFRHMFRHAYAIEMKWRKMADLVLHCEETLDRLQMELEAFFAAG